MVFEIEPDPQAAAKLKQLMAEFTSHASVTPSPDNLLLATMNSTPQDVGMDEALARRLKDVVLFKPLEGETLKKIFDMTTGKLLDKKNLTPRQRSAAEQFIAAQAEGHDPALGARGMAQQVKNLVGSGAFTELMEENSPGGTKRSFEKAIKGGAKKAGAAPATARFARRRGL